ncbi:hypothetical protein [Urbifossiella limnaea]|uniref:Uncharacterized protein n=1 Tax=Urbifossiella limnaea TaxID=2528023 RepID=A0A517Y2H3_9BACT|nr:hypothetical protein [Urbifossiella limnaea]QDU23898.1 hypothetical protein ETAA1_59080 [Urbifossiella limnaea]
MRRWLAAVGAVGIAAVAPAADPADLARRLAAPVPAEREAATRALAALGPAALPALEAAAASPNPEVARRAAPLLARARLTADSANRLRVPPVRLSLHNTPLRDAVGKLRDVTGVEVQLAGVADVTRPVTCDTGAVPPWEAVAAFARAAGLREAIDAEVGIPAPPPQARNRSYYTPPPPLGPSDVPVRFVDGSAELPAVRAGAVRVTALPPSFPGGRIDGQRTLHLDVTPLPGVKWEGTTGVRLTRVVDDTGRAGARGHDAAPPPLPVFAFEPPAAGRVLIAPLPPVEIQPPATRPNPRVVAVPVRPGSADARVLTVVEGEVFGEVAAAGEELAALTDVATGRVGVGGGGRLVVRGVDTHPGGVRLTAELEAPSPWERLRRRQPDGPLWPDVATPVGAGYAVRATDAAGRELPAATRPTPRVSDDGVVKSVAWELSYPVMPARLVVVGPRVVPVAVPFRLSNLPLP